MNSKIQRSLAVVSAAALVFGVSAVTSATAAPKTIYLAFQAPLTGPNALTGQDELTAAKFALSEYNATNPSVKVELVLADDQGLAEIAAVVAPGIAANKKIIGLIGPAFSGATQASLPAYKATGLPMISMSATRVSLTDKKAPVNGFPIFKRVVANDKFQGPALARYAIKGVTSPAVYLVDDKTAYGKGLADYTAPTTTPQILPIPPNTTQERIKMETLRVNISGAIKRFLEA